MKNRLFTATLLVLCLLVPRALHAFGEETGLLVGANHKLTSSHHLHLTRALAVCAGFPHTGAFDPLDNPRDAERIAVFDALSDQETFAQKSGPPYTTCTAPPYELPAGPDADGMSCPTGTDDVLHMPFVAKEGLGAAAVWFLAWKPGEGCFTSRYGPYSGLFHFPTDEELASLRAWAFGEVEAPVGRAQFAFGDRWETLWNAQCYAERVETVRTGSIRPGSLEALGIYLHALGDRYSHGVCSDSWGERKNPPWVTHTVTTAERGCAFSDHAKELGCPKETGGDFTGNIVPAERDYVENSIVAAERIYEELLAYAEAHGHRPKISAWSDRGRWLPRQVERFALRYHYVWGAAERARFAHALANACASLAFAEGEGACLPDVRAPDPPDFEACTYPLTPACGAGPSPAR